MNFFKSVSVSIQVILCLLYCVNVVNSHIFLNVEYILFGIFTSVITSETDFMSVCETDFMSGHVCTLPQTFID